MLARRSVAVQLLVLQVAAVVVVAIAAGTTVVLTVRQMARHDAANRVLAVAETFAQAPGVPEALRAPDPGRVLQPSAEATRRRAGIDFLVVTSPDGVRYTHPDPALIAGHFLGDTGPELRGGAFTETYTGTLGPSVRAVVPIPGPDGSVRGLVAAGITLNAVSRSATREIVIVLIASVAAVVLALAGAVLLSQRVRRQTRGLGSDDIARMHEHHDAMLHAVREGVLVLDGRRRVLVANDEARRLLGLSADVEGRPVDEIGLAPDIADRLGSGRRISDLVLPVGDLLVAVDLRPVSPAGAAAGSTVTLRDCTLLSGLTGELDAVWGFVTALRTQTHEAANRLHTVVTLVQLERYAEAVDFAMAGFAGVQQVTDQLFAAIDEPVLVALLLGKAAQAHERGVELVVGEDTHVSSVGIDPADLVTLVGNLIDNAVDAALTIPADRPNIPDTPDVGDKVPAPRYPGSAIVPGIRRVTVSILTDQDTCLVRVTDTGPGLPPDQVTEAFRVGWTTKQDTADTVIGRGIGLALVRQVVERYSGSVTVERDGVTVFTVRLHRHRPPTSPSGV